MAQKNRVQLKADFATGQTLTAEKIANLIDSSPNILDNPATVDRFKGTHASLANLIIAQPDAIAGDRAHIDPLNAPVTEAKFDAQLGWVDTGVIATNPGSASFPTGTGLVKVINGTASLFANTDNSFNVRPVFNVKAYGAISGGTVSVNNTAFAACFAACKAAGGGTVYIPTGTFQLSTQIIVDFNCNIQGEGMAGYETYDILGLPNFGATTLLCNSPTIVLFYFTNTIENRFPVRKVIDLTVFNNSTTVPTAGTAFELHNNCQQTLFSRVKIEGFYNNVNCVSAVFTTFENVRILDPVNVGLVCNNLQELDYGSFTISNSFIISSRTSGRNPYAGLVWNGGGAMLVSNTAFNSGLNYTLNSIDQTMGFMYSIFADFQDGPTSDFAITNCLMENYQISGIKFINLSGGMISNLNFSNLHISPICNPGTVRAAIDIEGFHNVVISNVVGRNYLGAIPYPFVRIHNCNEVKFGPIAQKDFSADYGVTSSVNVYVPQYLNISTATSSFFNDNFNRANTTNLTSSIPTGAGTNPWEFIVNSAFTQGTIGIVNNAIQLTSAANTYGTAVINTNTISVSLEATIATPGTTLFGWLCVTDVANKVQVNLMTGEVYETVGGTNSLIYAGSGTSIAGSVMKMIVSGTSIFIYRNNVYLGMGALSGSNLATKHGVYIFQDTAGRIDNVLTTAAP